MGDIIKKRFKCKLCNSKYHITSDMLESIELSDERGGDNCHRAFFCPICGQLYAFDTDGFGSYGWFPTFDYHKIYDWQG